MILTKFKKFWKTDYEAQYQNLIERLGYILNPQFDNITNVINGGITFQDNIQGTYKSFNVTVNSSGNPIGTAQINIISSGKVLGIIVLSAINQTSSTVYPTSAPFITYSLNGNIMNITNIAGLPANNNFLLTIHVLTA